MSDNNIQQHLIEEVKKKCYPITHAMQSEENLLQLMNVSPLAKGYTSASYVTPSAAV